MKEVKTGDIIKLKKEHAKEMERAYEDLSALNEMVISIAIIKQKKREAIWEFVYEIHPELRGFNLTYNDGTLLVKERE